jgi:hypothetical protein
MSRLRIRVARREGARALPQARIDELEKARAAPVDLTIRAEGPHE